MLRVAAEVIFPRIDPNLVHEVIKVTSVSDFAMPSMAYPLRTYWSILTNDGERDNTDIPSWPGDGGCWSYQLLDED